VFATGQRDQACRIDFLLTAGRLGVPASDLDADELEREFRDVALV